MAPCKPKAPPNNSDPSLKTISYILKSDPSITMPLRVAEKMKSYVMFYLHFEEARVIRSMKVMRVRNVIWIFFVSHRDSHSHMPV